MIQGLFALLRVAVSLKHIAQELRRSNDLTETSLELQYPAWAKSGGLNRKRTTKSGTPKLAHLDTLDIESINKKFRETHGIQEDE